VKKIKPVALAIVELRKSEGRQAGRAGRQGRQAVENSVS